jgi:hypothetical protein
MAGAVVAIDAGIAHKAALASATCSGRLERNAKMLMLRFLITRRLTVTELDCVQPFSKIT